MRKEGAGTRDAGGAYVSASWSFNDADTDPQGRSYSRAGARPDHYVADLPV